MLIGDTFYFLMLPRSGDLWRQGTMDTDTPSRVSDSKCKANEIAIWTCTNGARRLDVAAGKKVREKIGDDNAILTKLAAAGYQV